MLIKIDANSALHRKIQFNCDFHGRPTRSDVSKRVAERISNAFVVQNSRCFCFSHSQSSPTKVLFVDVWTRPPCRATPPFHCSQPSPSIDPGVPSIPDIHLDRRFQIPPYLFISSPPHRSRDKGQGHCLFSLCGVHKDSKRNRPISSGRT